MGLFDFLKVSVSDKKKPVPVRTQSRIEFDSKSFPLAAITTKGFVASQFDGSLIRGQNARVSVKVQDEFGRFSFTTTVGINDGEGGKLVGEWNVLPPETEAAIRNHMLARKRKSGG